jgi:sulfite dehydrogenase
LKVLSANAARRLPAGGALPEPGVRRARAGASALQGIAGDSGRGIDRVEVSFDRGASWRRCELGEDLGPYSFHPWRADWPALAPGRHELWVRASNRAGQVQVERAIPNPSGYQHNAYHRVPIEVRA